MKSLPLFATAIFVLACKPQNSADPQATYDEAKTAKVIMPVANADGSPGGTQEFKSSTFAGYKIPDPLVQGRYYKDLQYTLASIYKYADDQTSANVGADCTEDLKKAAIHFGSPCEAGVATSKIQNIKQVLTKDVYKKASLQEIFSLIYYTSNQYTEVNKALRDLQNSVGEKVGVITKGATSAINKLREIQVPSMVYRGANFSPDDVKSKFIAGEVFYDRAFLSTSVEKLNFYKNGKTKIDIKIPPGVSPSGAYVAELSLYPSEKEFLFAPMSKFKVLKVEPIEPDMSLSDNFSLSEEEESRIFDKFVNNIEFTQVKDPKVLVKNKASSSEGFALDSTSLYWHIEMEYVP